MDDEVSRRRAGSVAALRALSHPVRLRMWGVLAGGASSAAELARALGVSHASASYHLRVLRDAGVVVLLEERQVQGGLERRYRMVELPDEPVGDEPTTAEDWIALVSTLGTMLQQRAGSVSSDPKWFDDVEVWVTPEAVGAVRRSLDNTFAMLREAAVAPAEPGAVRVSMSALLFSLRGRRADGA